MPAMVPPRGCHAACADVAAATCPHPVAGWDGHDRRAIWPCVGQRVAARL